MESFYGGRQGTSFVIKKKFKYLSTEDPAYLADVKVYGASALENEVMASYVIDPSNKDLWYNEYCIIDTTNKNNPNNGKIYRRTAATEADQAAGHFKCAEYIGQIVGPSSGAPMLKPSVGLLDFNSIRSDLSDTWDGLGIEKDGEPVIYDPSFSDAAKSEWPAGVDLAVHSVDINSGSLVPGYDGITPRDDIKYNWFNVRKNTENNDGVVESWCYIGFEIPYSVFTVSAKYKTPGTAPKVYEQNQSKSHPFWWDWMFEIPNGMRGISVESIFNNDKLDDDNPDIIAAYTFDQLEYDRVNDTYSITGTTKNYGTKAWFCELRIENPNPDGDETIRLPNTVFFLGLITEVKDVSLDTATGKLVIEYHNQDTQTFIFDYPKKITIDQETGKYTIDYSDSPDSTGQFGFVNKAAIDSTNGKIKFTNTVASKSTEQDFIYPKSVAMDKMGNVSYLNSASKNISMGQLCFVDDVIVDDAHQLLIAYTDNSQIESQEGGTVQVNGKSYINYGQTIGKLGVESSTLTDTDITGILAKFTAQYPNGVVNGQVSGALHVVTTTPTDGSDPKSYFVMWDPDASAWINVSEIYAGNNGVVAQIGYDDEDWGVRYLTYPEEYGYRYADGALQFVLMAMDVDEGDLYRPIFPWE